MSRFPRPGHQPERLTSFASPSFTPSFSLSPGQRVFTIGSCFARNIEEHLAVAGFEVAPLVFSVPDGEWQGVRANGILNKYTPAVIRSELERAASVDEEADRRCLVDSADGRVVDLQLAANVAVTAERGLERRRQVSTLFRRAFDAEVVVITLGQTESWWDAVAEMHLNVFPPAIVHRHHIGRFFFEQLGYAHCLADVEASVELLLSIGCPKRILLSVSPVPLGRTFAGGDALTAYLGSKSILRAVAEAVTARYDEVDYLPTYEAMMLSDRRLVFDPNLHIHDDAVGRVVASALDAYLSGQPAGHLVR